MPSLRRWMSATSTSCYTSIFFSSPIMPPTRHHVRCKSGFDVPPEHGAEDEDYNVQSCVDPDLADRWGDEGRLVMLGSTAEEEEGTDAEAGATPESNRVRDGKQRPTEHSDCLPPTTSNKTLCQCNLMTGHLGQHFAVPTPQYANRGWSMYEDFVGAVQFWDYGLSVMN
ncbi:hypothetical protein B0H13DRAFT_1879259 [Mycena leptocephala]|nr:hypothetical protein B0H13DRAFT_1879259 [Mycena leptocephala]